VSLRFYESDSYQGKARGGKTKSRGSPVAVDYWDWFSRGSCNDRGNISTAFGVGSLIGSRHRMFDIIFAPTLSSAWYAFHNFVLQRFVETE
jgi:hypothetical protein